MSELLTFPFKENNKIPNKKSDMCLIKQRRCLENWKNWLEIRKRFQERVSGALNRESADMVLNSGEQFRSKQEEKMIFEYTKIIKPNPKTGHPFFWEIPDLRSKKCPSLKAVPKKEQQGIIPSMTYVSVPNFIRKEKGTLSESGTQTKSLWDTSAYKKKRAIEMRKKIKEIQFHKPDLEDLVVFGKTTSNDKEKSKHSENISLKNEEFQRPRKTEQKKIIFIASLEINDKAFSNIDREQNNVNHCINIKFDISRNNKSDTVLKFRNTGNVVIRYHWTRIFGDDHSVDILPKRQAKYSFIFRKSEEIILPGESEMINIYFHSVFPGIHKETWELCTEPSVFTVGRFRMVLWTNAESTYHQLVTRAICTRIEEGMKYTIVDDVVQDLLNAVLKYVDHEKSFTPFWLFNEADIFEAVNSIDAVKGKKRIYFVYDEQIINQMKQIYKRVRRLTDPVEWNLDLLVLENVLNELVGEFKDEYNTFKCLYCSLQRSVRVDMRNQKKYLHVYLTLCSAVDNINQIFIDARDKFCVHRTDRYPRDTRELVIEGLKRETPLTDFIVDKQPDYDMPARKLIPPKRKDEGEKKVESAEVPEKKGKNKGKGKESKKDKGKGKEKGKEKEKKKKDKTKKDKKSDKSKKHTPDKPIKRTECDDPLPKLSFSHLIEKVGDELVEDVGDEDDECTSGSTDNDLTAYSDYVYAMTYDCLCSFVDGMENYMRFSEPSNEDPTEIIKALASGNYLNEGVLSRPTAFLSREEIYRIFDETEKEINETRVEEEEEATESSSISELLSVYSSHENLLIFSHYPVATEFSELSAGSSCEIGPPNFQDKEMQTDDIPEAEMTDIDAIIENEIKCTSKHIFDTDFKDSKEDVKDEEEDSIFHFY